MKIEFEAGSAGLLEAESLFRISLRLPSTAASLACASELERSALSRLDTAEAERLRGLGSGEEPGGGLSFWSRLTGPSKRELDLGRQRSEALERADRAEKASFEAVADMAAVERERDIVRAELEALRAEVAQGARGNTE